MRPFHHQIPRKTGLPAGMLLCTLVLFTLALAAAGARADAAPHSPRYQAAQAVGGEWRAVSAAPLAGQRINALLVDRAGRVWAGTEERGLALWNGKSWQMLTVRDGLPDNRILALFADDQDRVWVATGAGLGYLSAGTAVFQRLGVTELTALPVLAFAQDADGAIYLGTAAGLSRWRENGAFEKVAEFAGQRVTALHTDRDEVVWAGTEHGLWLLRNGQWLSAAAEARQAGLRAARIRGIAGKDDGTVYVQTEREGLWRTRGGLLERMELPAAISTDATAIGLVEGRLWLGTHRGLWAHEAPFWQQYDASLLPGAPVTAIAPAPDGRLWIGTEDGLVEYQPDRTPPVVEIVAINGLRPREGSVTLAADRIERIEVRTHDGETGAGRLTILTQLDGVDDAPQVLRDEVITAYSDRPLAPGESVIRVWAQDEAFNRSAPAEVTVIVPEMLHVPGGVAVRSDVAYPALGAMALVLVAGATTRAAIVGRRRHAARAVAAEAERVRSVVVRAYNPFKADAVLPDRPVQEVVQALTTGNVLLVGERWMGKTGTLRQAREVLADHRESATASIPVYLDLSVTRPDSLLHTLMDRIASGMEPLMVGEQPRLLWHETSPAAYGLDKFNADLKLLLTWLQPLVAPRQVRLVLLLDEAQVLDGYSAPATDRVRGVLARTVAGQIRAVLAGEHAPQALGDLGDLFRPVLLAPISDQRAREWLVAPVDGVYHWEPAALDLAVEEAEGRPERLHEIAAASVRRALTAGRIEITAADVAPAASPATTR